MVETTGRESIEETRSKRKKSIRDFGEGMLYGAFLVVSGNEKDLKGRNLQETGI